jgi:hypothetical protein
MIGLLRSIRLLPLVLILAAGAVWTVVGIQIVGAVS